MKIEDMLFFSHLYNNIESSAAKWQFIFSPYSAKL